MPASDLERKREAHAERIRRELLTHCELASEREAWTLLGQPGIGSAEAMSELRDKREVFGLLAEGRFVYPTFQFDPDTRTVLPGMTSVLQAKPEEYSAYWLLSWLIRPHLEFGMSPAETLRDLPDKVLAAFYREIEPITHG